MSCLKATWLRNPFCTMVIIPRLWPCGKKSVTHPRFHIVCPKALASWAVIQVSWQQTTSHSWGDSREPTIHKLSFPLTLSPMSWSLEFTCFWTRGPGFGSTPSCVRSRSQLRPLGAEMPSAPFSGKALNQGLWWTWGTFSLERFSFLSRPLAAVPFALPSMVLTSCFPHPQSFMRVPICSSHSNRALRQAVVLGAGFKMQVFLVKQSVSCCNRLQWRQVYLIYRALSKPVAGTKQTKSWPCSLACLVLSFFHSSGWHPVYFLVAIRLASFQFFQLSWELQPGAHCSKSGFSPAGRLPTKASLTHSRHRSNALHSKGPLRPE